MSDELFDIYFSGKVIDQDQLEAVKQKVGKLFNANEAVLNQLFSPQPTKIKKAVDMDKAIKYRVKFREAGAIVDIRPSQSAAPQPAKEAIPETNFTAEETSAAPVSQPSAPPVSPQETATASAQSLQASLAMPGSDIDETPETPAANFDTEQFDLGAANEGSLEEFAETVIAAPIPDISSLDLDQTTAPLDTSPEPEPLEVDTGNLAIDAFSGDLDETPPSPPADIDTSSLTVSAANTGSLEEFDSRPEPVAIPDTSKLHLA